MSAVIVSPAPQALPVGSHLLAPPIAYRITVQLAGWRTYWNRYVGIAESQGFDGISD